MSNYMRYADIILPLALPKNYTYAVPAELENRVQEGIRVSVQLKQKKYAGIIKKLHDHLPEYAVRPILGILDDEPIVHPLQLQLWEWLAAYYMCSEGEVMHAALPAHLKLSSETILLFNPVYEEKAGSFESLTDDEYLVAEALSIRKELTLDEVQQILDKVNVYKVVRQLIEKKVCLVYEELKEAYRPKTETLIRLSEAYDDEEKLHRLFDELEKAPRQLALLMAFIHLRKTEGVIKQTALLKKAGATAAHLKSLVDKNILVPEKQLTDRIIPPNITAKAELVLNEGQQRCMEDIRRYFLDKQTVLLHGVTSSGKTMIYIKLMESFLETGRQILYLLPEIALTAQIIRRLQKYFGNKVGVYHSRFNNNERVELWNKVRSGEMQIILGARSALLLPFRALSLIILDEEQDASFKQQEPAPRYHARDAAIYYASLFNAKVLLGSATPSLESYYNAQQGKYGFSVLPERYGNMQMPEMILVDSRQDAFRKKSSGYFTSVLKQEMEAVLAAGKQTILFQNRRGYAPYQVCSSCGWIPHCKHCDVSLTYHKYHDKLQCHYCGQQYPPVNTCIACGSHNMTLKNFGTEKVEDDLQEMFPKAKVARMDLDTVRSKDGHHKLIQLFEQRRIDILVGTQMVGKGLDFEHVSLVGILQADNLLSYPDFRVNERAFQLLEQVSGRAGRKEDRGKVIIQAGNTSHPVLQHVLAHDYTGMYNEEIAHRRQFGYPPFTRLVQIMLRHKQAGTVVQAALELSRLLAPALKELLSGPATPLVARVRNYYLQELLVRLPRDSKKAAAIKLLLKEKFTELQVQRQFRSVMIIPVVDPV